MQALLDTPHSQTDATPSHQPVGPPPPPPPPPNPPSPSSMHSSAAPRSPLSGGAVTVAARFLRQGQLVPEPGRGPAGVVRFHAPCVAERLVEAAVEARAAVGACL